MHNWQLFQKLVTYTVQRKTVVGENFGEFGKSGAIRQSFTNLNLYYKTAGIKSTTNQYRVNSGNAWLKLVATKSTWTLFNPRYSQIATVYASSAWITRVLFHKEVMLRHLEHFKLKIFVFVLSRVPSPHYKCPHHFSATRDDKVLK